MNKEFEEWWKINENEISMSLDGENFYAESWENNAKNLFKNCFEAGQQSAKPRWIPVKKRLPTKDDGQTYYKNRQMYVDVLCRWKNKSITLETFNLDGNFFCIPDYSIIYLISWQPLPEA